MLVLTRKINQTIVIGGNIRVTMTSIGDRQVRLAIDAPPDVRILREELVPNPLDDTCGRSRPPASSARGDAPRYRTRRDP